MRFIKPFFAELRSKSNVSIKYGELINLVRQRPNQTLRIGELAVELNTSRSALSKGFKRDMGISLKQYITYVLIQRARELICHTGMSVREIAYELGYEEPYYFHRVFKRETGKTPIEFRNEHLTGAEHG
jgi:YesN/AraC family two-component response regulator